GVADKVVEVVDWNPDVPADVITKIKEIEVKIADGSFSPFTGPISKADGSEGVASGATMADAEMTDGVSWALEKITSHFC
ncbi:BMP family ABC transporter substrate-binding protein, partial [Rhizobium ruizarguesonis]